MAKRGKKPVRKQGLAGVSRKMAAVRPIRGKPGIARPYHLGFKPPRDPNPEAGEGEPEVNG